jgi:hypothetical protein
MCGRIGSTPLIRNPAISRWRRKQKPCVSLGLTRAAADDSIGWSSTREVYYKIQPKKRLVF